MKKKFKKISLFIRGEEGFSLVEVAIVLVIIGLIIGGVLKGRELIMNAKLNMVAHNIDRYRVATYLFSDRYGALPGDFGSASIYLKKNLKDGRNNGIIEGEGLDLTSEAGNFWTHLAAAGLIESVGSPDSHGYRKAGQGVPAQKIGGVITIQHNPKPELLGHWFVLGKENGATGDGAIFTPKEALLLSQKMGSSTPTEGSIRGGAGANINPEDCIKHGRFNTEIDYPTCILYFEL